MALGIFNPVFGSILNNSVGSSAGRNLLGAAASPFLAKGVSKLESTARKLALPITGNRALEPYVASLLGSLEGVRSDFDAPNSRTQEAGPMADLRGRPDPLWAYNFDANFTNLEWPFNMAYIEDVDLPFHQFDRLTHYRGGRNYYYPGDFDLSQFTVRMYEDRILTTTRMMNYWRSRIRNPDQTVNMPREYKRNLSVGILDDKRQAVGTATLIGCWPISCSPASFQSSSQERIILSVEFSADNIVIDFVGGQ